MGKGYKCPVITQQDVRDIKLPSWVSKYLCYFHKENSLCEEVCILISQRHNAPFIMEE